MLLFSAHLMMAKATGVDAIELDNEECNRLAVALKNVGDFYHFEASQETLLWMNLIGAAAAIYGPRGVIMYKHVQNKHRRAPVVAPPKPASVMSAEQAAKAAAAPGPDLKPGVIDPNVWAHASTAG